MSASKKFPVGSNVAFRAGIDAFEYGGDGPLGGHVTQPATPGGQITVKFYAPAEGGGWGWHEWDFDVDDLIPMVAFDGEAAVRIAATISPMFVHHPEVSLSLEEALALLNDPRGRPHLATARDKVLSAVSAARPHPPIRLLDGPGDGE